MGLIDKGATLDIKLQAHALLGRAYVKTKREASAGPEFAKVGCLQSQRLGAVGVPAAAVLVLVRARLAAKGRAHRRDGRRVLAHHLRDGAPHERARVHSERAQSAALRRGEDQIVIVRGEDRRQLLEHQPQLRLALGQPLLFGALLGDVGDEHQRQPAIGGRGDDHVERFAVARHARALALHRTVAAQRRIPHRLVLRRHFGRNGRIRFAEDLRRGPAEEPLRRRVPQRHAPLRVDADHRQRERLQELAQGHSFRTTLCRMA